MQSACYHSIKHVCILRQIHDMIKKWNVKKAETKRISSHDAILMMQYILDNTSFSQISNSLYNQ